MPMADQVEALADNKIDVGFTLSRVTFDHQHVRVIWHRRPVGGAVRGAALMAARLLVDRLMEDLPAIDATVGGVVSMMARISTRRWP